MKEKKEETLVFFFVFPFLFLLCVLTPSGALKSVVNFVPLW
jgi:hypothetical protein